ncbi:hypothetical protein GC169_11950 [bacterium]|nr:hypothetical protein [bacterium]
MTEAITDIIVGFVVIALVLFAVFGVPFLLRRRRASMVVVEEFQLGLLIRKGLIVETLKPGKYSTWLTENRIELYDLRSRSMHTSGQEVLTSDLLPVRVSLIIRYRIVNPRAYRAQSDQPYSRLYEDVQVELRKRVAAQPLETIVTDRGALVDGFVGALADRAQAVGLELEEVMVRDLTLAGPAKHAYADIWKAKKDGEAALERARGEQASLRSLSNAARMLKGNPELMNLRLLQALAGGAGKPAPTVVLGGGGLLPVSAGAGDADAGQET